MKTTDKLLTGVITISYCETPDSKPVSVVMPESDRDGFQKVINSTYSITENHAKQKVQQHSATNDSTDDVIMIYDVSTDYDDFKDEVIIEDDKLVEHKDEDMSGMSREELQARLDKNKAEVSAIASEMRGEMAEWREQSSQQLNRISNSIIDLSSKVDSKISSIEGEIKAVQGNLEGLQGQISGMNTAMAGIQTGISLRLTFFAIAVAILVALPGIFNAFKSESQNALQPPQTTQPIIIQIPQQQDSPQQSLPKPQTNR